MILQALFNPKGAKERLKDFDTVVKAVKTNGGVSGAVQSKIDSYNLKHHENVSYKHFAKVANI